MESSRIEVKLHKTSEKCFCGLIGRYSCISLSPIGLFRLFDGEHWYELNTINKNEIQRIKRIALRDKGSLYVKIRPSGIGYILDEPLR